jgi:hypothetical protein
MAFNAMVLGGVLDDIPGLRIGFLEIGSELVSYAISYNDRRRGGDRGPKKPIDAYFRDGRIYVTCVYRVIPKSRCACVNCV